MAPSAMYGAKEFYGIWMTNATRVWLAHLQA
jgi:hypothetical protein